MSKKKINRGIYERCLLTEVSPYETPIIFSNWGSYNYFKSLSTQQKPKLVKQIFEYSKSTIPYNYRYTKDLIRRRTLSLMHPCSSPSIIKLFQDYEIMLLRLCQKSNFSIRFPKTVAKYFLFGKGIGDQSKYVEQLDENKAYASSYFSYSHFSHLHKFFESQGFTEIEKKFDTQRHIDVSKCFPSIYTHSIAWAIRGKLPAKRRSFKIKNDKSIEALFDQIMQTVNFNETNGIIIGPELSRVFAEVIFQQIDMLVETRLLTEKNHKNGLDYQCVRYIDDYFIFYNDPNVANDVINFLAYELERFKLYLNSEKDEILKRPFITGVSEKKIAISRYVKELFQKVKDSSTTQRFNNSKEIDRIRGILNSNPSENHGVTNFFLAALTKELERLARNSEVDVKPLIQLLVDLVFYLIRIDTRVSSIYRLAKFILTVKASFCAAEPYEKNLIFDKLYYELCETIKIALKSKAPIELDNLIIAASELGNRYQLSPDLLASIIHSCQQSFLDEEGSKKRLTYFEIISILFYIKNDSAYENQRKEILNDASLILTTFSPIEYSESAHLLFDLVSCPYLIKQEKKELASQCFKVVSHGFQGVNDQLINEFVNFVESKSWFANWNASDTLKLLLKKKEFMLSY